MPALCPPVVSRKVYRPRLVRHRIACYAARAAGESWFWHGRGWASPCGVACDVGFLAVDPARAADLAFTAPYVLIEGTYIVPTTSPLREVEDVDREGVRIAAGKNGQGECLAYGHVGTPPG